MSSCATIDSLGFGTGESIFTSALLPAIESAQSEVLFVTCFWAASRTRDKLHVALVNLSHNSSANNNDSSSSSSSSNDGEKIRVRVGFSSASLTQKLFHPQSPSGKTYPPESWTAIGLPAKKNLPSLDMQVQSRFFLPFSVWHPKFVVVDRKRVFLPSCNVSWEDWFEGCIELSGPVVRQFVDFWAENWACPAERAEIRRAHEATREGDDRVGVPCEFLPSPHHRNPAFRMPWQRYAAPPATPLNMRLLRLFADAKREIYVQTPNVTAPPVLDALQDALARGVNVTILTSKELMILEQLVTAGTTTSRCVQRLIKYHKRLAQRPRDEEAGLLQPGRLCVSYYVPHAASSGGLNGGAEPVQSHLKLTITDSSAIVFGSGNMDRASWYTSQELGVAFYSEELVAKALQNLRSIMSKRSKVIYDNGAG